MKKLTFIVALLLLSCRLFAQTSPTPVRDVSGIIKDASGKTLANVSIVLTSRKDTLKAVTNADGIFTFGDVKQATFVVSITDAGYTPMVKRYAMNDVTK